MDLCGMREQNDFCDDWGASLTGLGRRQVWAEREIQFEYVEFKEFMAYLGANVQQAQERGQAGIKIRDYII